MKELKTSEFDRVQPLFAGIEQYRAAVFTVLEGTQAGRVFVDRRDRPSVGLVWSDFCYVAGNAVDERAKAGLLGLLRSEVIPRTEHVLIHAFTDPCLHALDDLFQEYPVQWFKRTVFDWDPAVFTARHSDWRARVPGGYTVQRFDARTASLLEWLDGMWGGVETFLRKGFGFCVLQDASVVSSCQTVFVGGGAAETGVGTEEPYRRQGLATAAACAYLEHCLAQDIRPEWGCGPDNVASGNLAAKLGFTNPRDTEIAYIHVPEEQRRP